MRLRAQRCDRQAGIVDLVAAEQLRRGEVEQAVVVLIDEAAVFELDVPVLTGGEQRCT